MLTNKEKHNSKTILLIGSTGKGKSTLANVIIDLENKFKESGASVSGTREIQKEEFIENSSGISYAVIDTVGLGDTKLKKEEVLDKIAEAVYLAREGISQILFVIDDKFNPHEMANYDLLKTIIFDNEVINYTTIIRTRFKDFKIPEKRQEDINLMIEEGGKLSEIIESCQKRVIYVDNPSLNLLPDDAENEAERKKEEEEVTNEIVSRKKTRSASRKLLIEHLQKICLVQEEYRPRKLQVLSAEISDYMEQKIKKRKELEEKKKKLGLENKKKEEIKVVTKSHQVEQNEITSNVNYVEQEVKDIEERKNKVIENNSEKSSVKGDSKFRSVFGKKFKSKQISPKEKTKWRITKLKEEIEELGEVKKLKEEIEEKEKIIREKVLEHILANYSEIINVKENITFIDNIGLSKIKSIEDSSKLKELLSQLKDLEKNSENKEDLMILSLEEIEIETKKKRGRIS